jgi:hypothetical protein
VSHLTFDDVDIGKLNNMNSFNPERWENPTKAMKDAFFPFGGGSRSKSFVIIHGLSHQYG